MKLLLLMVLALITVNTNSSADAASASGKNSGDGPPDTIFVNGDIYTQATPPRAQAMAVRDGRILAVGTNDAIRKLKGAHTQIVDLGGHFVMPGFNDAHVHLEHAGLELLSVDLTRHAVVAGDAAADRGHAKTATPGEWLVGGGWDQTLWADAASCPAARISTR